MSVKFRVHDDGDEEGTPSEHLFNQDRITIGRGSDNDLTLSDPKRVVSTEHAEVRRSGRTYQLVDRGSKNFTYLHDQRLEAGRPYELADGDTFQIGDFEIEFVLLNPEDSSPASAETVFAADFSNPFTDPAQSLVESLEDLVEAYEQEAPQRRDDALQDAFRRVDTFEDAEDHRAVSQVLDALGIGSPTSRDTEASEEKVEPGSSAVSSESSDSDPSSPKSQQGGAGKREEITEEVLDTLLKSLSRVIDIPWQFRHEFIGQTIIQSSEEQFLYDGDVPTMRDHLLDPSITQDERRKRLARVEDAAEALATHQVAMLNGYKASVTKGAEKLLERLDPDVHEDEVPSESVLYESLHEYVLANPDKEILERIRAEWNDLNEKDWSAAEQRIFRPVFIKAYLARMTAVESPDGDEKK